MTQAIHKSGFNSSGRFDANSDEVLGMRPTDFRAGGTKAVMRFAIGECSLGSILVAASEKGVTAILLGDDPEALIHDLEDRFSQHPSSRSRSACPRSSCSADWNESAPCAG